MTVQATMREAFDEAVRLAGSQAAFARAMSRPDRPVSQQNVSSWQRKGRLPADLVLRTEALTGVRRERLRPDVFCEPSEIEAA